MLAKDIMIIVALIALTFCSLYCLAIETNQSAEEEIWELEETYHNNYKSANHSGILAIYHKNFLGWPGRESQPTRKSGMPAYLEQKFPEPRNDEIEIERKGIQINNNVAINHYTLHVSSVNEDGERFKQSFNMTHTWLKEGGQWKILGGMSYDL